LRRADGRSIYTRHGGTRYATRAQLAMENRMTTQASATGAPRMARAQAAHALGADLAHLEDALTGRAHDTRQMPDQTTGSGLHEDQAAAALAALADGRLVSVINASAGSGKTRVLAEIARIWAIGGGAVIGITPSQSARNTLAAGVPRSYNSAQFLGHLPGRRGARGAVPIGPDTLLLIDEASMLSGPDLAGLIAYAKARGAKIILAGDLSQLQAVQNGGGMSLLAQTLGYARLARPVRFRHAWEQQASLGLRDGDTTVLAEYDQHGRILGGDPEQMTDAAATAYVTLTASGTDTLLMAAGPILPGSGQCQGSFPCSRIPDWARNARSCAVSTGVTASPVMARESITPQARSTSSSGIWPSSMRWPMASSISMVFTVSSSQALPRPCPFVRASVNSAAAGISLSMPLRSRRLKDDR
jgi:AAA domain-containing protein